MIHHLVRPAAALAVMLIALVSSSPAQSPGFEVSDALEVKNLAVADLSADGHWLALTVSSLSGGLGADQHRTGDPTYVPPREREAWVIDTRSGERRQVFPEACHILSMKWSPDGSRLLVARWGGERVHLDLWKPETGFAAVPLPADALLDINRPAFWSADGDALILCMRPDGWQELGAKRFRELTEGPVIVLKGDDPFLAWEQLRRRSGLVDLMRLELASGALIRLLPDTRMIGDVRIVAGGSFVVLSQDVSKKTDYQTIFGTLNDVHVLDLRKESSEPPTRRILSDLAGGFRGPRLTWSRNGDAYVRMDKSKLLFARIEDEEPRVLSGDDEEEEQPDADAEDEDRDDVDGDEDEIEDGGPLRPVSLSPTGAWLVATNKQGYHFVNTGTAETELFLAQEDDEEEGTQPRRRVLDWTPNEDGVLLLEESRTEWRRRILRCARGSTEPEELWETDQQVRGVVLSRDGSTAVFLAAAPNRTFDVYTADSGFRDVRRLTEANPQLEGKLGDARSITYLDVDGKETRGVLYYPLGYEEGQQYPTVFNIYEQYFDPSFSSGIAHLASNGYAVVRPSVHFETGYPGEAWVKGVTAAANEVIRLGVADGERLGVHGGSYGGYATNLLIAQTQRFKAAINISGKVNMVSFYTDSPRLGVRNIHAPENSQDRIGATLWEQPQKYIAHSAIMFADRIKTPLLLLTGEEDHNVPARQAMEMYYALRRLGGTVEWVSYRNGGHGMPRNNVAEVSDYLGRILEWYDRYLKPEAEGDADPDAVEEALGGAEIK